MVTENPMIHPTAYLSRPSKIHPTVTIGPYCIIGDCEIGKGTSIHAFTEIKDNSIVGENVIIRGHCIIGDRGFIFLRNAGGNLVQVPHVGVVVLEDFVELSSHINIDRGITGETRIKRGTKIDHYSYIAHNCIIGEHCVIAASTVFAGESSLGDYSFVGVGAIIRPKTTVGINCSIGMGAVVTKDVTNGWLAYGNPARMIRVNERGFLSKRED